MTLYHSVLVKPLANAAGLLRAGVALRGALYGACGFHFTELRLYGHGVDSCEKNNIAAQSLRQRRYGFGLMMTIELPFFSRKSSIL